VSAFGVYVHWPFCKAKCPYCDFNSHVRHTPVDAMGFARSLGKEIATLAQRLPGRTVSSIFFGGGTPSLMPPDAVGLVLDVIGRVWGVAADAEVTLEANPTSTEAENFRGYRTAGVNRVSVGVQSLNPEHLRALGRQHTPEEALAAFRLAVKIFPRASFDMIYARPHQTLDGWRTELQRALAEQQGHMSLYQLTIEPETRYADLFTTGQLQVPDEDVAADLYELTQELTEKAGLPAYEISNHARPGEESRHNLLYWRYGEYVGAGPGAHGRLHEAGRVIATAAEKHPETWRQKVDARGHGLVQNEVVTPAARAREMLLMGLRINEGINLARYEALAGKPLQKKRLETLIALGLARQSQGHLQATPSGRRVLDAVIAELAD
jgi:oxygen-independent coproporphyrinogen-3 oxidase